MESGAWRVRVEGKMEKGRVQREEFKGKSSEELAALSPYVIEVARRCMVYFYLYFYVSFYIYFYPLQKLVGDSALSCPYCWIYGF